MIACDKIVVSILSIELPKQAAPVEGKPSMIKGRLKRRVAVVAASLLVAGGVGLTVATPTSAAGVMNYFECDTSTGWCNQTNGPYDPNYDRSCRWNEHVNNSWGMYYTDCTPGKWRPHLY